MLKKRCDIAEKKSTKFRELSYEYALLENEYAQLQEDNADFSATISALESELADESTCTDKYDGDFSFQTKSRRYSPAI